MKKFWRRGCLVGADGSVLSGLAQVSGHSCNEDKTKQQWESCPRASTSPMRSARPLAGDCLPPPAGPALSVPPCDTGEFIRCHLLSLRGLAVWSCPWKHKRLRVPASVGSRLRKGVEATWECLCLGNGCKVRRRRW